MLHDFPALHADQALSDFNETLITHIAERASLKFHTLS